MTTPLFSIQHSAFGIQHSMLAFTSPIQLSSFSWWIALALFAGGGAFVVLLGMRSLAGLGPVRKWVAIGARLAVLLLLILIIGGVRYQRQHKDLEIIFLNDISFSTRNLADFPGAGKRPIGQALDDYYRALAKDETKRGDDRLGLISFGAYAKVEAIPNKELRLDNRAIPEEAWAQGTDAASAIQLALATMSPDAMHRLVLVSDGNWNAGDMDAAVSAAASQHVPIDVVPLKYDVRNEVLVDRFEAPSWKRENEPFNLRVVLRSTNGVPVTGKLRVQHQTKDGTEDLVLDATADGKPVVERPVTLKPGLNVEVVKVPALKSAGVHKFHALFAPDKAGVGGVTADIPGQPGSGTGTGAPGGGGATAALPGLTGQAGTKTGNNAADAFTFVQGKGEVLYVDNMGKVGEESQGALLAKAMAEEGITFRTINIDQFPQNLVELQSYTAVVLANVPRGGVVGRDANGDTHTYGLSIEQDKMLRSYVHDMGGGLVMIGGPDTFGAGGWEGSEVEKILPIDMAIPAQRQVGKGALVLVMHSCEMPQGNFWGEQCALQAVATLSARDDIGVISYGWGNNGNNGIGGAQWDFPLAEKGDGARVNAAIKRMQLGDMPSFDDTLNLALNGVNGGPGLLKNNARHKHIIIISDGDPTAPQQALMNAAKSNRISISTVTVFPHSPKNRPPVMEDMATFTGGKSYGPIEDNPNQLPQIFIKEATIVKRSLIHEPEAGIPIKVRDESDDMVKGIDTWPVLRGMVLTSRKKDPKVEMPLATGAMNDPILAHWQTGLGKSAVWTSDATRVWGAGWVSSVAYNKLFAQMIRGVSRPPMSGDFDVRTTIEGTQGEITVTALDKDGEYANFLNVAGSVIGGANMDTKPIRLVQTGPGTYKGTFPTNGPGSYVAYLTWRGKGKEGQILTGAVMNSTPENRDLKSNEARLEQVRAATGGRMLEAFSPVGAELFSRDGLRPSSSPLPVWDLLVPWLLALMILDVAVRRIAWDWNSTKKLAFGAAERVRAYTTLRRVEARPTLDALKRVRDEVVETKFRTDQGQSVGTAPPPVPGTLTTGAPRPDPRAKFEAKKGVEGDITQVVGGATDKPVPPPPKKIEPKGGRAAAGTGEHLGGLMAAKKRAQQQIKEKEQGDS